MLLCGVVLGLKHALVFGGAAALAVACGQKFSSSTSSGQAGSDGNGNAGEPASAGSEAGGSASGSVAEGGKSGSSQGGRGGDITTGGHVPIGGDISTGGDVAVGGGVVTGGNGGSGGIAPAAPIPTDGLELWLRSEQGITLRDKAVAVWKDSSTHHRDATQTANNYQPTFVPAGLVGKPGVAFDGVDDQLTLPTLDADFSAGLSVFLLFERDASDNTCEGFFEASNGSEVNDINFGSWRSALHFEVNETWVNDPNYPLLVGAPQVAVALKGPMGDTDLRSNSNGAGQGTTDAVPTIARSQVFLGHTLYKDCGALHGVMGEVLLYSRRVSDQELLDIEAYLQKKWGCCSG